MRKIQSPSYSYIEAQTPHEGDDKILARKLSAQIGLEAISISATEASLIQFISQLVSPSKIVEIGTLTGLSSLYFLETLKPDGYLWTFEKSPEHAALAAQSLDKYIKKQQCTIVQGDAVQMLPTINGQGPFDIIFIDGNKAAYYEYWKWAQQHIQKGGVIFIDNAFLAGSVWGDNALQKFNDKQIANVKKMTTEIFADSNFTSSFVPTTEGLLMARRKI